MKDKSKHSKVNLKSDFMIEKGIQKVENSNHYHLDL